jgi:rSAM/selenodomain-associated transferase 2
MRITVIVPVVNEEEAIGPTLRSLFSLEPAEVIVVDGGSSDRTREVAARTGARLLVSGRGRARQMNKGARAAAGDVLLFLHADTRPPPSAMADVAAALADPRCVGGRFDVTLDGEGWILRVIGFLISLRSRLTRVATGDQAIFVRRQVFETMGGFPEIPIMEDIAFCRELKKRGQVACLRSRVVTSARRWEKEGIGCTIVKMWALKSLFLMGVSPFRLKRFYGDTR